MPVTLLQKYVFKEWFWTLLAVSVVLTLVLMGVFLGELLDDMADGRIPAGLLGIQLLLNLPNALGNILPLSAFVAVMWGLGRLYQDHEMVVMRSSGFGWRNLLRPLFLLIVPLALFLLLSTFVLGPRAVKKSDEVLQDAFRSAAILGLQEGKFHLLQGGELVIYVEELNVDGRRLRNVFVQQRLEEGARVWQAAEGEYWLDEESGQRYLTLTDGTVTDSPTGGLDVQVLTFKRNDFLLPEPPQRGEQRTIEARRAAELLASGDLESRAELQWRLAPPLAVLVLALLAVPLAHQDPREGRGGRVLLGVFAYACYANLLYLCRGWIADGTLPAVLGLWWVHGLVLLTALLWLQRQGRMVGKA
jgi:lipopolysaccharide export system permease protein